MNYILGQIDLKSSQVHSQSVEDQLKLGQRLDPICSYIKILLKTI